MNTRRRALVLSGGGYAGGAWMLGVIEGLRQEGVDLGAADLIVGTSAGARVGAQLATGTIEQVVGMHRNGDLPPAEAYATLPQFVAASMRIIADSTDPTEAARRIATMPPLGHRLPPAADRRAAVAALLPRQQWPQQGLLVTAVDADTGQRVAFDAGSGVELIDAVTASGALPGIYPLVAINGRRYADGGVHSLYHADLATGNDKVVVLSAMPLNAHLRRSFDTETAALHPATVHLVVADDESLRAMGPDPAAIDTAPAALEAGMAQARREAGKLRQVWDG